MNQKILITGIIIFVLIITGIFLVELMITQSNYPKTEILNLAMFSKAFNPYNDSDDRFLLPIEDSNSSVFDENSEIYVCANITTLIGGSYINIEIYKISNTSIPLNISIPERYKDLNKKWDCVNLTNLLLKEGEYKIKYILYEGSNKKEKEISFKILNIQEQNQSNSEKFCNSDSDCACGVHVKTGKCFYGNKNFVDPSKQCPDFCTGIAGNLEIKCIENACKQVKKQSDNESFKTK